VKKIVVKVPALPDGSHREAGKFDSAGRWYPAAEVNFPGAFAVRTPSRAWPYSYLKHLYTARFSRALLFARPEVWFRLAGLRPDAPGAEQYVALYAKERLS